MVAQIMLRTYEVKKVFSEKIIFDDPFDATKCFQQIEIPYLLHMCAYVFRGGHRISAKGGGGARFF